MAAGIVITFFIYASTIAQGIDNERMNKDLEVAENILSTLGRQSFGGDSREYLFLGGDDIEGSYIEGYGVVFSFPSNFLGHSIVVSNPGQRIIVGSGSGGNYDYSYSYDDVDVDVQVDPNVNISDLSEKNKESVIELMKLFLVDYADLIGQLKPTDRIMISEEGSDFDWDFRFFDEDKGNVSKTRLSAEILKSDITKYKEGKLTRDQALEKVKVIDRAENQKKYPDLELLASIFDRLYREDLSDTYHLNGKVRFEKIEGLGAVFSLKLHQHDGSGRSFFGGYSNAKSDEEDKRLYPIFIEEFKRNILEYGRTIKSIDGQEQLLVKVNMDHCSDCPIPKNIAVSVKVAVLKDYLSGKLSIDDALGKLKVSEASK